MKAEGRLNHSDGLPCKRIYSMEKYCCSKLPEYKAGLPLSRSKSGLQHRKRYDMLFRIQFISRLYLSQRSLRDITGL